MPAAPHDAYSLNAAGVFVSENSVVHRDDEFNQAQLEVYAEMEPRHFWFAGRRRFLAHALARELRRRASGTRMPDAIDLGAGCGGWVQHLGRRFPGAFSELAIADSSARALELAARVVGADVPRYQVDLRRLDWRDRWDITFLLDVLEHIADDQAAMEQVAQALRPGGLLFVTTPALERFRSYNDALEHHQRRYSRRDFAGLAERAGFELLDARYFMFLLSPLLLVARSRGPDAARLDARESHDYYRRTHRVPPAPLNAGLRLVFAAETPLGHWVRFPWGTSLLGVFRKPD